MTLLLQNVPPALSSSGLASDAIDATTDMFAWRIRCDDASPILKAQLICFKTGTPHDVTFVLVADNEGIPTVGGGVPTDIGGGSPTAVTYTAASFGTSAAVFTITFTNGYTPSAGDYVWLVAYSPGTGGTGLSASHKYTLYTSVWAYSSSLIGHERVSVSSDTGTSWTALGRAGCVSFLTTGDAYISTLYHCCISAATGTHAFNSATNPGDERAISWTLPSGIGCRLHGLSANLQYSADTADWELRAYLNDIQQGNALSVDISKMRDSVTSAGNDYVKFLSPIEIINPGTVRLGIRATHASSTITVSYREYGALARKQSAKMIGDMWAAYQTDAGGFTDETTKILEATPIVEFFSTGGPFAVHNTQLILPPSVTGY